MAELLGDAEALSDTVADIVASCEGNPFFAEESARLVADQVRQAPVAGLGAGRARGAPRRAAARPQGDAQRRRRGRQRLLGRRRCRGGSPRRAMRSTRLCSDLVAKHLVRRVRHSSMAGENEFAFAHALAREVAYGELPRAVRATRAQGRRGVGRKQGRRPRRRPRRDPRASLRDRARSRPRCRLARTRELRAAICRPLPDARRRPSLAPRRGCSRTPLRPSSGDRRIGPALNARDCSPSGRRRSRS